MTAGIDSQKGNQLGGGKPELEPPPPPAAEEEEEEPRSKSARADMARTCISSAGM